jgi:hypothetical protein
MEKPHIVDVWLANQQLERLEEYLKCGRPLASASIEELKARWVTLTENWAKSPRGVDHREREDIEAEMQVRKVSPPVELAKDAIQTLRRKSKERTDKILQDPERYARMARELHEEVDQFEATTKGKKN